MNKVFVLLIAMLAVGCNFGDDVADPVTVGDPTEVPDAGLPSPAPSEMDCAPGATRDEVCRAECGADNSYLVCRPNHVWECIVENPALCTTPAPAPTPVPTPTPACDNAVYWRDADGDGYGNPTNYIIRPDCDPVPTGYVDAFDPDCNDSDRTSRPGGYDLCGDGVDQDCSGADLACPTTTCVPTTEICGNGIDEDCSGADLACAPISACERDPRFHTPCVQPATSSHCVMAGVWSCVDGSLSCALTVPVASTEVCGDGIDQDCNGSDIACASICTPRPEICGNGIDEDCNGSDIACAPSCVVRAEICGNSIDEDCNGSDLACATIVRRTVYELYVPGDTWDASSFRLRNGLWWGDENIVTCLNTGTVQMRSISGGWYRCVADRVNPFIGSYRARSSASDYSTFDASRGACVMTLGVLWRVYDEVSGMSLVPSAGLTCDTSTSGGAPRHRF